MIASHYAAPVPRRVNGSTTLYSVPSEGSGGIRELDPGEPFDLLDDSAGWSWGYAGADRRVGYVRSDGLVD